MRYKKADGNALNRMLTVDEVAYALHVHPTTIRKWAKLGQLKSYRLGAKGNVRFRAEDVSLFYDSSPRVLIAPESKQTPARAEQIQEATQTEPEIWKKTEKQVAAPENKNGLIKKALSESEDKFARIFSSSPVALAIVRLKDEAIIEVNNGHLLLTGYRREELIGHKLSEFDIFVNSNDHALILDTLLGGGQVINREYKLRIKSGKVRDVLLSMERITVDGEDCMLILALDISERKQAEELVKNERDKAQRYLDIAAVIILSMDARGNVTLINRKGCEVLGYSQDEIIGKNWFDNFVPRKVAAELRDISNNLMLGNTALAGYHENPVLTKKGEERIVAWCNTVLMDNAGNIVGHLSSGQDITESKKAEKSIRESEEKFRNLFENAKDAIILADTETGIVADINPAGCKMLGLAKADIIGKPQTIIHPPELADKYQEIFREHVAMGIVDSDDTIIQRANGRRIPANVSASVIEIGGKKFIQGVFRDISGRKMAEQARKDSEEKFSRAFNVSANAICITSLEDNKFVEINDSYMQFTGYSREEVIGHTAAELNLWVVDEQLKKLQEELAKEGKFRNIEFNSRHKSGEIRTGLGSAELIQIAGKPCRIVVITDITERKKAVEALKDSEEKFSKAFDFSANAICITTLKENRFIEANESFTRFTGYSRDEVIGHSASELDLWVKPEELKQWLGTLEKEGRVFNQEFSSRMKSGEIRVGLSSAEVITIGGEPCRIVVITDITERKKAEETLRFSDAAFKSIHESVIALDDRDNVTYWNSMSEQLFGVRSSDVLGRNLYSVIQPVELYRGQNDEMLKKLREQGFNRAELLYNTPRTKVWVDMTVRAIEKDGKQYGHVMTASDISERKRMEQELDAYRTHLEELVEKRTAEVSAANQKLEKELEERKRIALELVKARDTAEGASRTKGDFLARMSHEIRTPIHGVIGTLNLLLDSKLKDEQRQYGSMARASAESLLTIINDILDFSKIEAGQLALEETEFNLYGTVEESLQPMALMAHKKELELTCHISPAVPQTLVGDANRLRQILINLIGNGVKFTPRGEVAMSVNFESEMNDQIELGFVVRDTGIGIPGDKQEALFDPFVQANGSKYGGTGLGLSICRQLVKMMQGRIWLESEPGRGSSFHFTARFKKNTSRAQVIVPAALAKFKGAPVLIVDDNASSRLMLADTLNNWGLLTYEADDEQTALERLQKIKEEANRLPVILMDMIMPAATGLEIVRKMGGDLAMKRNIIMMLNYDNISDDFSRCQEAGVPVHLIKPIKRLELQDAIVNILGEGSEEKHSVTVPKSEIPQLKLRILVAEDNPTSQLIARKTLEKMGCKVELAGNGVEAARLAQQGGFDLVLMDFEMPEMNGLEATRVIRGKEKETHRHLPIVAMTAYAMKQDRDKCFEAGMDGYITKPVSPENLYNAIKGIMPVEVKTGETPAVDIESALKTVGGDVDILKEVLQVFLQEDSPKLLKNIDIDIVRQDGKALKAEAHGMKGASAAMGGQAIAAAASRLETAALNGDMTAARVIYGEMVIELERLKDYYAHADFEAKGGSR